MLLKALETEQIKQIAEAIGLIDEEEFKKYMEKIPALDKDADGIINDAKRAAYVLAYILKETKKKRHKMVDAII